MSKLEELINQCCPNGVKYKTLKEIAEYAKERIDASEVDEHSYVGVDNLLPDKQGKRESTFVPNDGRLIKYVEGDVLIGNIRPYLKKIWLADNDGGTNGDVLVIHLKDESILPKYLYFCLSSDLFFMYDMQYAKGAKMPRGSKEAVMEYKVPAPPLEVQREIVQILDKFTLLSAELSAELSARKKQYDFYGNMLFESISDDVNVSTVGETIVSLKTGLNPRKNFTLNEEGACFPYITGKDIFDNQINVSDRTDVITSEALELINKRARLEEGLLLFASTGTGTVGRMAIINEYNNDWGMSETLYGIKVDESIILPHYLMYFLYSVAARKQFEPKITKGSVPHLKVKDLLDVKIPVPTIEVQRRIVNILSRFDKMCNGMIEGLPAEIEARKKQYEYYRDRLLTFKEAV